MEAVPRCVHLLDLIPRPPGVALRVGEYLLRLRRRGVEVCIGRVEACPRGAVEDAVVIGSRHIVAECLAAAVTAVDVPTPGIILPHRLTEGVGHPRGHVVAVYAEDWKSVV